MDRKKSGRDEIPNHKIRSAQQGNITVVNEIIEHYLGAAGNCIEKFGADESVFPIEDQWSRARMGIWKAIQTYDENRAHKQRFTRWVWFCIYQELARELNWHNRNCRIMPESRLEQKVSDSDDNSDGRELHEVLDSEVPCPFSEYSEKERKEVMDAMLKNLPERDARWVRQYYEIDTPMKQSEISESENVSRQLVYKVIKRSLAKLKELANSGKEQ